MSKINVLEGKVVAKEGMRVGIVASRFNEIIVNKLLGGAVDGLVRHGVDEKNITAAWVPGAFEIPVIADKMASSGKYSPISGSFQILIANLASSFSKLLKNSLDVSIV